MKKYKCDVLVVGGGLGGVSAALKATSLGATVMMTEETGWIGGQLTTQAVSCLDEHPIIETFGGTANYYDMRNRVRQYYRTTYTLSEKAKNEKLFNPGASGKRICFEPKVGVKVLNDMVKRYITSGQLEIYYHTVANKVIRTSNLIKSVELLNTETNKRTLVSPKYVIDATELGDLLPLAHIPYRTGVESFAETREPSAPGQAIPMANQGFTFPFAVEWCPGENHTIPKPSFYDEIRRNYPFTLNGLKMFGSGKFKKSFWEYRRILAAENFNDPRIKRDISLINWISNDYHTETIIDQPKDTVDHHLYRAKQLSLSFLYWLQTEAPRDEGGYGYPELKLRPDLVGTSDGLSHYPYIRESRRIKSLELIKEQDIVLNFNHSGARSRLRHDSVGLGTYFYIDIHPCSHTKERKGSGQTIRPFQLPMGALLTSEITNFIAGSKNIGTTHITNGTCRLHPIEWTIGEAAGCLAAYCIKHNKSPMDVYETKSLLKEYQLVLLKTGVPLFWYIDLPLEHENFIAVQYLTLEGFLTPSVNDLYFYPSKPMIDKDLNYWIIANRRIRFSPNHLAHLKEKANHLNRGQFAQYLYTFLLEKKKL